MTIKSQETPITVPGFQPVMQISEWQKRLQEVYLIYGNVDFSVTNDPHPFVRGRTTAVASPPTIVTVPVLTGDGHTATVMSCGNGVWTSTPDYYTYQWFEGATAKGGQTSNTYTIVAGDDTKSITCKVIAWHVGNSTGSTASQSNAVVAANP